MTFGVLSLRLTSTYKPENDDYVGAYRWFRMSFNSPPFDRDTTERLSCRSGDMLIWFKWGNPFIGGDLQIADIWTLTDGDQVILTNRVPDIPT